MTEPWYSSEMAIPYSHPPEEGRDGVELRDHLADVVERARYVVSEDMTTPTGEPLDDVVETVGYLHDFGKATTYFQQYIGTRDGSPDRDVLRHHAPIGSFASYYALDARGFDTETCLAGFVAVAKHHGRLPNVAKYIHDRAYRRDNASRRRQTPEERQQAAVWKQIHDIDEYNPELARQVFDHATGDGGDWASFRDGFEDLLSDIEDTVATRGRMPGVRDDALSDDCYGLVLQCWGALILADKTSAADAPPGSTAYDAEPPSMDRLDEYVRTLEASTSADAEGTRTARLNHYRSQARRAVIENAESFARDGAGVATLTLPTGMGKTLTGLSAALRIRDQLEGDRVVYALPFTSVIDQVVDEVEEIYRTDTTGRLLTAHHHLAETELRGFVDDQHADETDIESDDVAGMLGESWRAGLTVTTFVQLFESLAGPRNSQGMKLPALHDSVVVLDEPQSLPLDWWKLVPRLARVLTEQYGATVIAMTATQPKLFDDATELVDDPDAYFEAVERVTYELDDSTERYIEDRMVPKQYGEAATELRAAIDAEQSTLAVCNTIDSARTLHEEVSERIPGAVNVAKVYGRALDELDSVDAVDPLSVAERVETAGEQATLHLSTRLRPADRLKLVEIAKELTIRECAVAVTSTQLVEAGVDISFDRVYRDLAPIDSLVQAAGRCNRSFERDRGRVVVWWLEAPEDQDKTPAEAVYNRDTPLLPEATSALESVRNDVGSLNERAVARTAVERYYDRLHDEKNVGKQSYADHVDNANAKKLGELSLIDQRLSADILVGRTERERELADQLPEAYSAHDYDRFRKLLDETKPLRISVPYYREDSETAEAIRELPALLTDEGIYYLDVRQHRPYFDETIGFVVPGSTTEARLI
jgi:CRISPR-associated endonuclease Cas3-HD